MKMNVWNYYAEDLGLDKLDEIKRHIEQVGLDCVIEQGIRMYGWEREQRKENAKLSRIIATLISKMDDATKSRILFEMYTKEE